MIRAKLLIGDHRLTGFEIRGHAMFAPAGSDVVCAAVSSAAYLAANTITDVLGEQAQAQVTQGRMIVRLAAPTPQSEAVLRGLAMHLTALSRQYPTHIKVFYGGVQNASD